MIVKRPSRERDGLLKWVAGFIDHIRFVVNPRQKENIGTKKIDSILTMVYNFYSQEKCAFDLFLGNHPLILII